MGTSEGVSWGVKEKGAADVKGDSDVCPFTPPLTALLGNEHEKQL